jgi:hypothetical protein
VPASAITGGAVKDPLNGNAPFPGNLIPAARISPVAKKLQQYYPAPNLAGLASNLSVAVPNTASYNQTVDRIDQNIGDKIRLNVRAHWQKWDAFGGNAIPRGGPILFVRQPPTSTPLTSTVETVPPECYFVLQAHRAPPSAERTESTCIAKW